MTGSKPIPIDGKTLRSLTVANDHLRAANGRKLAARLWWTLLPYAGWITYNGEEGAVPPPWYAHPLGWAWKLIDRLPNSAPFEPMPPTVCNCDYCRGVPGARFEP